MRPPRAELPSILEAVDPGQHQGWAEFYSGELVNCGMWDLESEHLPCTLVPEQHWVIEDQVVYKRSKADPNDIITLAKSAARSAERIGWDRVEWVEPRRWKSNLPPDIVIEHIIECLRQPELEVYLRAADSIPKGLRHNVVDAIGLGLWRLRRYPPR